MKVGRLCPQIRLQGATTNETVQRATLRPPQGTFGVLHRLPAGKAVIPSASGHGGLLPWQTTYR